MGQMNSAGLGDEGAARRRPGGVYPMLYAFWREDGTLDEAAMERQVEHVVEAGADGVAVLGLVTESHRLDASERLQIVAVVAGFLAGRLPLSVTVTGESVEEQRAFAGAAREAGADWLIFRQPRGAPKDLFRPALNRVLRPGSDGSTGRGTRHPRNQSREHLAERIRCGRG